MQTVAELTLTCERVLDPEGELVAPLPDFAADLAEVRRLYRAMSRARAFDTKAMNLQRTGQIGTYARSVGHEATHVGVAAAMHPDDLLAPYYRELATQLWRGVSMTEMLLYWGGDERGNDFAGPRQDFPWCVPIATQTLHATGAAMAFKLRREPRCAVTFIGDGGTSEGDFYEAINMAGARALPVVFVIVNNGWAISVPVRAQTAASTLAQKAVAAGIPAAQVDGNDVFAVRAVAERALTIARSGRGPSVIEALTYRLSDHTTADDASRYRGSAEVSEAWRLEPLARLRQYLTRRGAWNPVEEEAFAAECATEIESAVAAYLALPPPSTDAMFDHLFATLPPHLEAQRVLARAYASKPGGAGSA